MGDAILVYSNDTSNDFCTVGPSFTNASGWTTSPPMTVPPGKLYLWAEHTTSNAGQAYTFVIARAGDGVRAASLTLEGGARGSADPRVLLFVPAGRATVFTESFDRRDSSARETSL